MSREDSRATRFLTGLGIVTLAVVLGGVVLLLLWEGLTGGNGNLYG